MSVYQLEDQPHEQQFSNPLILEHLRDYLIRLLQDDDDTYTIIQQLLSKHSQAHRQQQRNNQTDRQQQKYNQTDRQQPMKQWQQRCDWEQQDQKREESDQLNELRIKITSVMRQKQQTLNTITHLSLKMIDFIIEEQIKNKEVTDRNLIQIQEYKCTVDQLNRKNTTAENHLLLFKLRLQEAEIVIDSLEQQPYQEQPYGQPHGQPFCQPYGQPYGQPYQEQHQDQQQQQHQQQQQRENIKQRKNTEEEEAQEYLKKQENSYKFNFKQNSSKRVDEVIRLRASTQFIKISEIQQNQNLLQHFNHEVHQTTICEQATQKIFHQTLEKDPSNQNKQQNNIFDVNFLNQKLKEIIYENEQLIIKNIKSTDQINKLRYQLEHYEEHKFYNKNDDDGSNFCTKKKIQRSPQLYRSQSKDINCIMMKQSSFSRLQHGIITENLQDFENRSSKYEDNLSINSDQYNQQLYKPLNKQWSRRFLNHDGDLIPDSSKKNIFLDDYQQQHINQHFNMSSMKMLPSFSKNQLSKETNVSEQHTHKNIQDIFYIQSPKHLQSIGVNTFAETLESSAALTTKISEKGENINFIIKYFENSAFFHKFSSFLVRNRIRRCCKNNALPLYK